MSIRVMLIETAAGEYDKEFIAIVSNVGAIADIASNFDEVCTFLSKFAYDLVIIQVFAPWQKAVDPIIILQGLTKTPILALLEGGNNTDFIRVLEVADDCLTKPFNFEEAVARGAALIKKPVYPRSGDPLNYEYISVRGLLIMPEFRRVFIDSEEIVLQRKEFDILEYLAKHKNQVISKDALFRVIWPESTDFNVDRIITYHISNIRKKIQKYTAKKYIDTVHGSGYRFITADKSSKGRTEADE